jgi:hypothetical protein
MSDTPAVLSLRDWLRDRSMRGTEGVVAFARFLRTYTLDAATLPLYLDLFEAGVPEALDVLLEGRDPAALFTRMPHSVSSIGRVFGILTAIRPREAAVPAVLPLIGLLEAVYTKNPQTHADRPLSIADVNQIGKFLVHPQEQVREIIARLLETLGRLAWGDRVAANHAGRILDAFLDNTKTLATVIPAVLLV